MNMSVYICVPQKDRMNMCESIYVYHRRIAWTFVRVYLCTTEGSHEHVSVYLCTTEGSHEHVWEYICVPQKDRMNMCESIYVYHRRIAWTFVRVYLGTTEGSHEHVWEYIFLGGGEVWSMLTILFILKESQNVCWWRRYPKFLDCFKNKFQPSVKIYHNASSRKYNSTSNWTNNNCKSSNHIMKLDANWKENPLKFSCYNECMSLSGLFVC